MPAFDDLADQLRRQRETLQKSADDTSVSQQETGRLLEKIDELRRRSEATNRRFPPPANEK